MGKPGITLSRSDQAAVNMLNAFKKLGFTDTDQPNVQWNGNVYLFVVEPLIVPSEKYKIPLEPKPYPVDYDKIADMYQLDYIVVASRHWSSSGKPSLTVHPTGNFGKAVYGGRNRELQKVPANVMRNVFLELLEDPPKGFEVSLEATHHSPTEFKVPLFFVELGSSKRQWSDEDAGAYLAEAILNGIASERSATVALGFGGGHYCPKFSELEKELAFGHICPKYALDLLDFDLIRQMVEKTHNGVELAILEKGMKGYQRKKVEVALKKMGLEAKTVTR